MTHAASGSVGLTALEYKLGNLTQELAAFRSDKIRAAPVAAASSPAGPPARAAGTPAANEPHAIEAAPGDHDCRIDDLGVIAYVLGLRRAP